MRAEHPAGAQDQVASTRAGDGLLAAKLGGTIDREGIGRICFDVRVGFFPVKHIVG